jgi:hypothetical protein
MCLVDGLRNAKFSCFLFLYLKTYLDPQVPVFLMMVNTNPRVRTAGRVDQPIL